ASARPTNGWPSTISLPVPTRHDLFLSFLGLPLTVLEYCQMHTLKDILQENVRPGILYERIEGNRIRCYACGHCCPIAEGQVGVCKVRFNRGGRLYVPWGYVAGVQCDPVEKKPFFHAYPGALAYSFGMLGCDLHCAYCQNWVTSQALRDPDAGSPPLE